MSLEKIYENLNCVSMANFIVDGLSADDYYNVKEILPYDDPFYVLTLILIHLY